MLFFDDGIYALRQFRVLRMVDGADCLYGLLQFGFDGFVGEFLAQAQEPQNENQHREDGGGQGENGKTAVEIVAPDNVERKRCQ